MREAYARKVGALIYCLPSCRIDCAFAIGMCARCLTFPTAEMDAAADRVLVYLGTHRDRGLNFSRNASHGRELLAYSDSDWQVAHSTSGYVIFLGGSAVAYASKRQHCVALSSTEAEIMAASLAAAEIVHIRGLLREMGHDVSTPTVLYVDNEGAVALSNDMRSCNRSRHIERRYLRIREWVADGEIVVKYVATTANVADALTKPLDAATFTRHATVLMNLNCTPLPGKLQHSTFDIEAAYLKGEFEQHDAVFARPPKDWRHTVRGSPLVWKLKIPLYGEADAGRIWNRTLVRQLRAQRFVQSQFDPCYFRKVFADGKRVDILMYVDDGYVVTDDPKRADAELKILHAKFTLKRKPSDYFLGNNIAVANSATANQRP